MIEIKLEENNKQSIAYDNGIKIVICEFIDKDECWNIIHTEVNNSYKGQGIARKLVECIIVNAHKYNKNIIAECTYAKKVLNSLT